MSEQVWLADGRQVDAETLVQEGTYVVGEGSEFGCVVDYHAGPHVLVEKMNGVKVWLPLDAIIPASLDELARRLHDVQDATS